MRGLVVHQDARYARNRGLRLFDGARFLTRAISYQRVIGTRCEVCAIKWAFICTYKTKVRWIFQVFLTSQKSTALFYFSFNDNGY